jgi:DNA-binding response OmpR family regulator
MPSLLLVADAEWVRNDVKAAVTDPTTSVDAIDDPKAATERAAERHYDVIVVDMQVGSMGGMAITRLLHDAMATEAIERTPVVMLLDRKADEFLARRAGANAFLVKPFTSQELRSALSAVGAAS